MAKNFVSLAERGKGCVVDVSSKVNEKPARRIPKAPNAKHFIFSESVISHIITKSDRAVETQRDRYRKIARETDK